MPPIRWSGAPFIVVDVGLALDDIVARAVAQPPRWVVLEHRDAWRRSFYAYLFEELAQFLRDERVAAGASAIEVLKLTETSASQETLHGTVSAALPTKPVRAQPPAMRVVGMSADGEPVDVGEIVISHRKTRRGPSRDELLGQTRGGEPARQGEAAANGSEERVDAILSAEGPKEIEVGTPAVVDVRAELAAGATPLSHVIAATIAPAEPIVVILTVEHDRLEIIGPRLITLAAPTDGAPSVTVFQVQGRAPGPARLAVMFRQGASDLGTIPLITTVVAAAAQPGSVTGRATATARDPADDDVLVLLVDEDRVGDTIRYRYRVYSKALGLNFKEFQSKPVLPLAGGAAATPLAYVESIHRQIVQRVIVDRDDLGDLADELQGLGADLCRQLFSDDFVRQLWDHRERISIIQVTSWEPYIPWELLRLQHPDSRDVDRRFLAEYGLVRAYSGDTAPRVLHKGAWRYLIGTYPEDSLRNLAAAEQPYFTTTLPSAGVSSQRIPVTQRDLLAALAEPDFDVIHISCHGRTNMDESQRTELLISDRRTAVGVEPVAVTAATIGGKAHLSGRRPLVFLNACETGRNTASLTRWGGWPRTFFDAGAGAFVGTSWAVRDKPAASFAIAFYDALRRGDTLAEAAQAGRAAAKTLGDASWLAYVVYGNPNARMV